MTSQQCADHALNIWQSNRGLSHRERLRQIDEMSLDVIFDAQLRAVATAMYEPPPSRFDPRAVMIWTGVWIMNIGWIAVLGVIGWEIFRP